MPGNFRNRYLLLSDIPLLAAGPLVAYALRFEGFTWNPATTYTALTYAVISLPLKLSLLFAFGLYGRLWRHASMPEMTKILQAGTAAALAAAVLGLGVLPWSGITPVRVPISVVILDGFFTLAAAASPRLFVRLFGGRRPRQLPGPGRRALIAGAGAAGQLILKEIQSTPQLGLIPVGFVDDDPGKRGQRLGDLLVFGSVGEIPEIVERHGVAEIVIAMPTAPGTAVRRVVQAAREARVPTRTMPGLFEILLGRVRLSHLRQVEIQDLLRRDPVHTDLESVRRMVAGQTVLITGAGGSIGSELARQAAGLGPQQLVLLGNVENEIFDILLELQEAHPGLHLVPVIADIRDGHRLHTVFARFRPHAVFHAAAHKHVPLMESNAADAVTNNVLGTKNVVRCAVRWDTRHFVLISTDKAVRPTSVMGASKRAAELIVQDAAHRHQRNFVAVRFGNVLGSRGSVVPTFLRQIQSGGPVTVTHPDMRRYFMTIPEAVQLVLQAGALGRGGEVFVLDMGEPVKIVDLASDLIRLSGLQVGTDIELRFTGVRPGERLFEETFQRGEDVLPTAHPKILRACSHQVSKDETAAIDALIAAARAGRPDQELREILCFAVPEFQPGGAGSAAIRVAVAPPGWATAGRSRVGRGRNGRRGVRERRSGRDRRAADRRVQVTERWVGERRSAQRRGGEDRRVPVAATARDRAAATPGRSLTAPQLGLSS
jgi:FlaA1/EpsC-like NDP-sugar epimerase